MLILADLPSFAIETTLKMSSSAGNVPSVETTSQMPFVEMDTEVGAAAGATVGEVAVGDAVGEAGVVGDGEIGEIGVVDGETTGGVVSVGVVVVTGVSPPF